MKLEKIKGKGHRLIAVVLTVLLLMQAVPIAPLTAKAVYVEQTIETSVSEELPLNNVEDDIEQGQEAISSEIPGDSDPETGVMHPTEEQTVPEIQGTEPPVEDTTPITEERIPEPEKTVLETETTEALLPETEGTEPTVEETIEATESTEETVPEKMDPYALLEVAEEGYIEVSSAEQLLNGVPAGSTYVLVSDIAMGGDQQIGVVAGTLDGKGHTITLNGRPLAQTVTGTIQNLNITGTATIQSEQGGTVNYLNGGTIRNCSSTATLKPVNDMIQNAGGLVGKSEKGSVYNSYFAGSGKDEWGITLIKGIIGISGNDGAPSHVQNCYYVTPGQACGGSAWNSGDTSNGKKTLEEMKTPEFAELLNTGIVDTGYVWAQSEGGLPVLTVPSGGEEPSGNPQISTAEDLPSEIAEGITYELTADITLNPNQQITLVAGTLDGKGHTITLNGKTLTQEVTGTIQNLNVAGTAGIDSEHGSIANFLNGGIIQNCSSSVKMKAVNDFMMNGGGLAGKSENGKIYNCYFTGTGTESIGLVVINGIIGYSGNDGAPSEVKNCYYTSGNGAVGGTAWNSGDASNGKKTLEEMKTPQFADLLNADNVGSGYIWEAVESELPRLIPDGGPIVKPCDKSELQAAIQEAQSKNEGDYTDETWAAMQQALEAAKKMYDKLGATQEEVDDAAKTLRDAVAALAEKERELAPVKLPQDGVIKISSQEDLKQIDGTDSGKFYQLTQDITIDGNYWSRNLAGVFDGNGHTVTIRIASPLFDTILETGVVQNLRIKVEGNFTNRQEFAPYADRLRGGMIVNCISEVTGQHSAGFVRRMQDGAMVNCLTMGHNRRGALVFFQKSTDHQNTNGYKSGKFYNCYWSASNSVENITPVDNLVNSEPVGDERLRSDTFIQQLNNQKGEFGVSWGRDTHGYPYFGEDQGNHVIDGSQNRYPVQLVWHDGKITDVENGILELSPQVTDKNRLAGKLQLTGVPSDSTITWSGEDRAQREVIRVDENGELHIYHDGGAVIRAMEQKADGSQPQMVAEIRVVSAFKDIEALQLVLDGEVIDGSATVQGSAEKYLEIRAKYVGSDTFQTMPSYLVELTTDNPILRPQYNTASFYFAEPGTANLTVTEKTEKENPASVTVSITSAYVPVTSVKPAIGGKIEIHTRNSMGSGSFNALPQSVFIEPSNASYKDNFTIESSDPSIASFESNSYIPFKSGTVTFTAKLNDKGSGKELTGTSEATFVYLNPLTAVEGPKETITLKQREKVQLPLVFHGMPDNQHAVTEPNLVWTYDREGIVSIERPNPITQNRDISGPDYGNWVASTAFEVRGLKPGTVVATGTPVDTTKGAAPVTVTITVTSADGELVGFDIPKFITEGKQVASDYLMSHISYNYGDDWSIYTLLRDGRSLPQDKLDKYYDDVLINAASWDTGVRATDVERTALALSVMGKDITNVGGVNLVNLICNNRDLTKQGSNALAWALIALDMRNTEIPEGAKWTREKIVAELLTYQNADGGFGLDKTGGSGLDVTAMSLQALARYPGWDGVPSAIEKGMAYLEKSTEINLDLGSAESIAQVIITLGVLKRDVVEEPSFGDEMENIVSVLHAYMVPGEGFKHSKTGDVNQMATVQSMQALCAYERFLEGQSGYWDLLGTGPVESPADKVIKMIDALPENVTTEDTETVQAVRKAYEELSEQQKARVVNLAKLEAAEAALRDEVSPEKVMQLIAALPEKITLKEEASVKAAREAYNLLSAEKQAEVTNLKKLEQAEKTIADLNAAAMVERAIADLPNPVSIGDKDQIEAIRRAYNGLTDEQKQLVRNLELLTAAENHLEDVYAAQEVMAMIRELPRTITVDDETAVKAARNAYNGLTAQQRELVQNEYLLLDAEKKLEDKLEVKAVEDAIDALPGKVTQKDKDAVEKARNAYDALTTEQKKQITNLDKLKKAEKALRKPSGKPGGESNENPDDTVVTESNMVDATVKDGKVSGKQLEEIKGQDKILRIQGTMESGENYTLLIHGKDIRKVEPLNIQVVRKGLHEDEIHKLSENPEIFRFMETEQFPGTMMVELETKLNDGRYLLLRYDAAQQQAFRVSQAEVKDGKVKFIVEEGGEYFLAKSASSKSLLELEDGEQQVTEETQTDRQKQNTGLSIWRPLVIGIAICLLAGMSCLLVIINKRKEN